uniref:Uncharacterized protein n=1 Tax=Cannabis sativa TaxID=3483 RepID=A0A803QSC9_CANSA
MHLFYVVPSSTCTPQSNYKLLLDRLLLLFRIDGGAELEERPFILKAIHLRQGLDGLLKLVVSLEIISEIGYFLLARKCFLLTSPSSIEQLQVPPDVISVLRPSPPPPSCVLRREAFLGAADLAR